MYSVHHDYFTCAGIDLSIIGTLFAPISSTLRVLHIYASFLHVYACRHREFTLDHVLCAHTRFETHDSTTRITRLISAVNAFGL
jgi:hypothetical protein